MSKDTNKNPPGKPHPFGCTCQTCNRGLYLLANVASGDARQAASTSRYDSYQSSTSSTAATMTCPYCNKNFGHRGDLNKHIRTHTGEEPYACAICQKRFNNTSNLRRHEDTVHTSNRPFRCDKCGSEFNRKDKLAGHQQSKSCKRN